MDNIIKSTLLAGVDTERLLLRPLSLSDDNDMFEYTKCSETCKFLKWGPHTDIKQTRNFIEKALENYIAAIDILWGIEEKASKKLIGAIRIYDINHSRASISFILNKDFTGYGYMTEAVKASMQVCFKSLNVDTVYAYFAKGNIASENVMKRCGMSRSGDKHEEVIIKGKNTTVYEYLISRRNKQ